MGWVARLTETLAANAAADLIVQSGGDSTVVLAECRTLEVISSTNAARSSKSYGNGHQQQRPRLASRYPEVLSE